MNPAAANHAPLVAEASGGSTVAAIGNAVAHALAGPGIRDLPLTRERIMTALLKVSCAGGWADVAG